MAWVDWGGTGIILLLKNAPRFELDFPDLLDPRIDYWQLPLKLQD
jgi:hypothetical protein